MRRKKLCRNNKQMNATSGRSCLLSQFIYCRYEIRAECLNYRRQEFRRGRQPKKRANQGTISSSPPVILDSLYSFPYLRQNMGEREVWWILMRNKNRSQETETHVRQHQEKEIHQDLSAPFACQVKTTSKTWRIQVENQGEQQIKRKNEGKEWEGPEASGRE